LDGREICMLEKEDFLRRAPRVGDILFYELGLKKHGERPKRRHRIFLVRHGESEANANNKIYLEMPDHAIPLSANGHEMAREVGRQISDYYTRIGEHSSAVKCRMWVSPYRRAQETADRIQDECHWITDRRENILLGEQDFGLFAGIHVQELPKKISLGISTLSTLYFS